ncbi:MAG: homoserine kinase [Burkholderiales bacterium]|nr:homoserine kinase [Burkholderiales bacterium]
MAVFTEVSEGEAGELMRLLQLGELRELRGIQGGIENTNYFATTDQGEYVLTLFERLGFAQLPFYLKLMKHLAQRGIPVPDPAATTDGELLHTVCGKPAAVVNRLRGKSDLSPGTAHCAGVGAMLARMHIAGRDFALSQPNLRGLAWWNETVPVVLPHVDAAQAALLRSELAFQNHVAAGSAYAALPRGPIHADLFRDNVMFEGDELTGFFDFYFAGVDSWLFDIAVCLNDWCVDLSTGAQDAARAEAFLAAYAGVRPLCAAERQLLPAMQRAGALRFWVSRLWDFHLPREASMLKAHDPAHFERVLRQRLR